MRALFTESELADAALGLLASSSIEPYVRAARRAALGSQLRRHLKANPEILREALHRAKELWRSLLPRVGRGAEEAELAILLSVLAPTGLPEVEQVLADISQVERPTVAWIGALARRLQAERPANRRFIVPTAVGPVLVAPSPGGTITIPAVVGLVARSPAGTTLELPRVA